MMSAREMLDMLVTLHHDVRVVVQCQGKRYNVTGKTEVFIDTDGKPTTIILLGTEHDHGRTPPPPPPGQPTSI